MKKVYTGLYNNGVKIKTGIEDGEVFFSFRLGFDQPEHRFILGSNEAMEMSYALLKAVKELNDE